MGKGTDLGYFVLDQVTVQLGDTTVLDDISLSIDKGEHVCLLGPSGAGKTSLLRVLDATQRPHAGAACVGGVSLVGATPDCMREVRSKIGFVHQDHGLVPNLRVSQNVLAGKLAGRSLCSSIRSMLFPKRDELEAVHSILRSVGIGDLLFRRTDRLSGGERQRVALARALYQDPEALLADEPVASVDPMRARKLLELLKRCASLRAMPLVVSLHDPQLALEFFDRVVGLRAGRILFDLPATALENATLQNLYQEES